MPNNTNVTAQLECFAPKALSRPESGFGENAGTLLWEQNLLHSRGLCVQPSLLFGFLRLECTSLRKNLLSFIFRSLSHPPRWFLKVLHRNLRIMCESLSISWLAPFPSLSQSPELETEVKENMDLTSLMPSQQAQRRKTAVLPSVS